MSKPTESGFASLLTKYLKTLEPVARDVVLKNTVSKVSQPDGSTKIKMVPTKGDAYFPHAFANAVSKAVAKALFEQIFRYIKSPLVDKVNELIDEYNQLRNDFITGGGSTTASQVNKIP
jgi:hypothetical protein